jgi:hypothetical protein
MNNAKEATTLFALMVLLSGSAFAGGSQEDTAMETARSTGKILLLGESHGQPDFMAKELEIWGDLYTNQDYRHFFVEMPYYSAEFLNLWMQAEDDSLLLALYDDTEGTAGNVPATLDFYRAIKAQFPETIFHGTDVGHQFHTTGERYLDYLAQEDLADSHQWELTVENIEQGKEHYSQQDFVYREIKMTENFIRAFNSLEDQSIMGVYGSAHTSLKPEAAHAPVPPMAYELKKIYGDQLETVEIRSFLLDKDPIRTDRVIIGGIEYEASYFGRQSLVGFRDFVHRDYWRVEGAFDALKDNPKTGEYLPADNYVFSLQPEEVYLLEYEFTDGSKERKVFRNDGRMRQGEPVTEALEINAELFIEIIEE